LELKKKEKKFGLQRRNNVSGAETHGRIKHHAAERTVSNFFYFSVLPALRFLFSTHCFVEGHTVFPSCAG
jgi:hypothetical protein